MSRSILSFVIAATAILAVTGCAKKSAYPGAVYAGVVAAYQPAEFDGAMGGESSDLDGNVGAESLSWFFKTDDPMDKIVAFYERKLVGATKEVGEGEVTFKLVPEGCEFGEEVAVIVREGQIQVHESTKPGKHKDRSCYDKAMEETGLGWLK